MKRSVTLKTVFIIAAGCCFSHCPLFARNDTVAPPKRAIAKAAIETVGINIGVWAFDRYIIASDAVYNIDFSTAKRNFRQGFVWDNDQFSTNLLGHPYHGGLYFNAARSSGMNFGQSLPYSIAGSLMWEYCMENEPPSINDFISTSIGGAVLGEITFRLSGSLIDNSAGGFNRFGRELLIGLISPMRELNRIFSGEAWKIRSTACDEFSGDIPVSFYVMAGYRGLAEDSEIRNRLDNGMYVDVLLNHGNLFSENSEKPYDAFILRTSFNFFSKQPLIGSVNVVGQLWGKNIPLKSEKSTAHWGVFQHFDYYDSNTAVAEQRVNSYRIAETAAVGIGAQFKTAAGRGAGIVSSAYLTGILLGGSITDYYQVVKRDYNLGSGFSSKISAGLLGRRAGFNIKVEDYRLYTWKGYEPGTDLSQLTAGEQRTLNVQGDKGNVRFTIYSTNFYWHFRKHCVLSFETSYYFRDSYYRYFPNIKYQIVESKLGICYLF
ncbi:MAG: DUF3943 domain-containing protein [Prevotellaceae bacterium]|jgi:hypothetical protein|nr:DUF3943 domain-containing protein [Prevotellaceae bacterium]